MVSHVLLSRRNQDVDVLSLVGIVWLVFACMSGPFRYRGDRICRFVIKGVVLRMALLAFKVPFLDRISDIAQGIGLFWLLLEHVDLACVVDCSKGVIVQHECHG